VLKTLGHIAKEYVSLIEQIEKTSDPERLQNLEERRVALHGQFMDLLKTQGIEFKDREHAVRIAYRIATGEL
jgi:hypothetical protein